jgi:hypothetical protein
MFISFKKIFIKDESNSPHWEWYLHFRILNFSNPHLYQTTSQYSTHQNSRQCISHSKLMEEKENENEKY